MRISIDTSALFVSQAGVARYVKGLLKGIRSLQRSDLCVNELAWQVENMGYRQPGRSLRTVYRDVIWRCLLAPRHLRSVAPDLFHSPWGGYVRPPRDLPWVVTLHDLAVCRFPERYRRWHRFIGKRLTRLAADADRVVCISRFTADEAMKLLAIPHGKLEVIYNGCDFHPDLPAPSSTPPSFDVPAEYFLFVGSLEPGKNLALLREVYELAERRRVRIPSLLIVGARWPGVPGEGSPPAGWQYLGHQPDPVLVHLYRRALALLFPSKYEGFGLPIVEAMALGCPVVCAPVASLPEVAGEAAVYAPLQPEPWLSALAELARNGKQREECAAAGRRQVRHFSWLRCAEQTVAVYSGVLTP